jgi:hypothetical protein
MNKTPNIYEIINNKFNKEITLAEQAEDLGALVFERESEKNIFGNNHWRMAELAMMIERQEKLVIKMLNGDEEEYIPPPPKRPYLRIVK